MRGGGKKIKGCKWTSGEKQINVAAPRESHGRKQEKGEEGDAGALQLQSEPQVS